MEPDGHVRDFRDDLRDHPDAVCGPMSLQPLFRPARKESESCRTTRVGVGTFPAGGPRQIISDLKLRAAIPLLGGVRGGYTDFKVIATSLPTPTPPRRGIHDFAVLNPYLYRNKNPCRFFYNFTYPKLLLNQSFPDLLQKV